MKKQKDADIPKNCYNAVEELAQSRKHPTVEKVEAKKDALKFFDIAINCN